MQHWSGSNGNILKREARALGLEAALAKGKEKAAKVAASLGVKLLGVYDFMETTFDEVTTSHAVSGHGNEYEGPRRLQNNRVLNMEIQHSKTVQVNVEIWYRVSDLEERKYQFPGTNPPNR